MAEAVVVGGGVVGAATAYHLASRGATVRLFDREDPGRATAAGAGIVSPASSRHADPDWYDLAESAARYYPALVEVLGGAATTGYATVGSLVCAVDPGERPAYEAARQRVFERQAARGYPAADELYELTPAEALERFPPLADVEAAYCYEGGARVDGRQLTDALVRAGAAEGLETTRADVRRVVVERGRATAVETAADDTYEADAVVVAGGAWSAAFGDQLGLEVPVAPQRGQLAHLAVSDGRPADWPVVGAFRGHYLVPWADGRVVAGATREDDTGFDPRATAAGIRDVLEEALRVAPGLADAELREVRVGLRPLSADGLPIIGAAPGVEAAYLATGHGPTGLTLGPYTGKLVSQLVLDGAAEHDLSAFDPGRF